jgi:hypothetical protein
MMAGKAGQIIPEVSAWDPESGKRKYVNKTIHGTLRDAQTYLSRTQRDRDLTVFLEPSRMRRVIPTSGLETAAKPKLWGKTSQAGVLAAPPVSRRPQRLTRTVSFTVQASPPVNLASCLPSADQQFAVLQDIHVVHWARVDVSLVRQTTSKVWFLIC